MIIKNIKKLIKKSKTLKVIFKDEIMIISNDCIMYQFPKNLDLIQCVANKFIKIKGGDEIVKKLYNNCSVKFELGQLAEMTEEESQLYINFDRYINNSNILFTNLYQYVKVSEKKEHFAALFKVEGKYLSVSNDYIEGMDLKNYNFKYSKNVLKIMTDECINIFITFLKHEYILSKFLKQL